MTPYCIYCNLPITDGEELLSMTKQIANIPCENCNVSYIWSNKSNGKKLIIYYFEFAPKVSFTVYVPINSFPVNDEPIICHLTIPNLNAIELTEDYAFLPLNKLKEKLIKLLPFI